MKNGKNVEIYLMNQYSKLPALGTSFFYNVLVHAVKVTIENAETQYNTHMIVRCYNRILVCKK